VSWRYGVRAVQRGKSMQAEALKLAAEHGSAEASRRTGVSADTIRYWRHRAAKAARPTDADSDDVERLERLARDVRAAAEEALAKAREAIAAGRGAEAKNLAVTAGVAVSTRNPVLAGFQVGRVGIEPTTLRLRVSCSAN
jgi:hypothetical protein